MNRRVRTLLSVAAVAAPLALAGIVGGSAEAAPAPKKVGYFTQWSIYARNYFVKNLVTSGAASRLTHVNYAFANVGSDGRCFEANLAGQGDAWADYQRRFDASQSVDGVADRFDQPLAGNFNQLKKLKQRFPGLKVQLSIGGWTWSKFFSDAARSAAARRAFVSSCINLFIKGNLPKIGGEPQGGPGVAAGIFDGIDLDWEWPASAGNVGNVIRPQDKQNFTALLSEFRRQLDALGGKHRSLTAFLPADPAKINAGFETTKIFPLLDFATVQGYDFHGAWELRTNHQSAIRSPAGQPVKPEFSADAAINAWTSRGAPKSKLVLGMPFYGRGWSGVTNANRGLFQNAAGPAPGTFEAGFEDYKKLKTLTSQGYTLSRDTTAIHAWLFNGNTFWTFDDPTVLRAKTAYIKSKGLAGAMMWSLDGDDAGGSLIKAVDGGLR